MPGWTIAAAAVARDSGGLASALGLAWNLHVGSGAARQARPFGRQDAVVTRQVAAPLVQKHHRGATRSALGIVGWRILGW
ncbi:MAG: hypothetical protein MI785_21130, partial [Kiloniellales bacterium]|nr:hypothetical protein [Kiloniellales bacterium]